MSATEPLCHLIGIRSDVLSLMENSLLEAELFTRMYRGLKDVIRREYQNYFSLLRFNQTMENAMLETNFIRSVISDILSTEEYSLSGIACYTDTPEEVIHEVMMGMNSNPSLRFSRKIIELHRSVRPAVYQAIMEKIAREYQSSLKVV